MQPGNLFNNPFGQPTQPTMNLQPIVQALQSASNPVAMLQTMAMQNPQLQGIMNVISQNGGDPMRAFYSEAAKRGFDPSQLDMNSLSQMLQNFK